MKFQNLSVKRLFGRVAIGLVLSMSGITIALFLVTKQTAVLLTLISFLPKYLIETHIAKTDIITAHGINGNNDTVTEPFTESSKMK